MRDHNYGAERRRAWAHAHAISEVMGIRSSEAYRWLKHWRTSNVNLIRLGEGDDPGLIAKAYWVMSRFGWKPRLSEAAKISSIERSVQKARRAMQSEQEDVIQLRQRVQIMLWAIGKCGTLEKAQQAWDRAVIAISEEAETD